MTILFIWLAEIKGAVQKDQRPENTIGKGDTKVRICIPIGPIRSVIRMIRPEPEVSFHQLSLDSLPPSPYIHATGDKLS